MRKFFSFLACFLLLLALSATAEGQTGKARAVKGKVQSCDTCHSPLASILGDKHPQFKGNTVTACLPCHKPGDAKKAGPDPYSARLHRGHAAPETKVDCTFCHTWTPGKQFGLVSSKVSLGSIPKDDMPIMKEIVQSWAKSGNLDALHGKRDITCAGCHGGKAPELDAKVENGQCLSCHGSMAALEKKTEPKDFPDRNPHKSHLGEVACTVCHHAHKPSTIYCLGCHSKWNMKIPGGEAGKTRK